MNNEDAAYIRRKYHTDWGENWIRSPRYGLPLISGTDFVPDDIVPFDKIGKIPERRSCVVFNLADRRIDCFWNRPELYVNRLRQYSCVASPDFSLPLGMERQFISYNLLRAFYIGIDKAGKFMRLRIYKDHHPVIDIDFGHPNHHGLKDGDIHVHRYGVDKDGHPVRSRKSRGMLPSEHEKYDTIIAEMKRRNAE